MKENVHLGAHALTGLMFALLVIMFSQLNDGIDSDFLQIFFTFTFHYDISKLLLSIK